MATSQELIQARRTFALAKKEHQPAEVLTYLKEQVVLLEKAEAVEVTSTEVTSSPIEEVVVTPAPEEEQEEEAPIMEQFAPVMHLLSGGTLTDENGEETHLGREVRRGFNLDGFIGFIKHPIKTLVRMFLEAGTFFRCVLFAIGFIITMLLMAFVMVLLEVIGIYLFLLNPILYWVWVVMIWSACGTIFYKAMFGSWQDTWIGLPVGI